MRGRTQLRQIGHVDSNELELKLLVAILESVGAVARVRILDNVCFNAGLDVECHPRIGRIVNKARAELVIRFREGVLGLRTLKLRATRKQGASDNRSPGLRVRDRL